MPARAIAVEALVKAISDDIEYGAGPPSEAHLPVARICASGTAAILADSTWPARNDAARNGISLPPKSTNLMPASLRSASVRF